MCKSVKWMTHRWVICQFTYIFWMTHQCVIHLAKCLENCDEIFKSNCQNNSGYHLATMERTNTVTVCTRSLQKRNLSQSALYHHALPNRYMMFLPQGRILSNPKSDEIQRSMMRFCLLESTLEILKLFYCHGENMIILAYAQCVLCPKCIQYNFGTQCPCRREHSSFSKKGY